LGQQWSILQNGYKPYPCGFVAHAMIDTVRDLRSAAGPGADLAAMTLEVSPESTHLMGNSDPTTGLEAKFSLLYDAAVAWVEGNVTPAAFDAPAVADPRYRAIMERTRITAKEDIPQHSARGSIVLADGRVETAEVAQARGTPARPLTDGDLIEKWGVCFAMADMDPGDLAARILAGDDLSLIDVMDYITGRDP
jgi:2-methylcitrate dehydratase PrpD